METITTTQALRSLLNEEPFIYIPVACDALGSRLVQDTGFKAVYSGGFATGASRCVSEPLLTMSEQVRVAADVANAVAIPTVADGGAGFGDPLHTMRTVREFIRAGIAGIHIEDQLYPKRAHYHKYVAHAIPRSEYVDKIKFACRARDEKDKDFVIIARSDTCRFNGPDEALARVNMAADVGADMGLFFPRDLEEMKQGPKISKLPLVYVLSRGNRDGRPLATAKQLAEMGYKACIDALTCLLVSFHHVKKALVEISRDDDYTGMTTQENIDARQHIEDLVGLQEFYEIEEATVEKTKWGKR